MPVNINTFIRINVSFSFSEEIKYASLGLAPLQNNPPEIIQLLMKLEYIDKPIYSLFFGKVNGYVDSFVLLGDFDKRFVEIN